MKNILERDLLALGVKFVDAALEIIATQKNFEGDFYKALGEAHAKAAQVILQRIDLVNKIPAVKRVELENKVMDHAISASYGM